MKIKDRIIKIQELSNVKLPWEVKRVFPAFEMHGSQVCFGGDADFVTLGDMQIVLDWMEENFRLHKAKK